MPETAIESFEFAHLGREYGSECVGVDRCAGLVFGVAVAMFLEETMEEFE